MPECWNTLWDMECWGVRPCHT